MLNIVSIPTGPLSVNTYIVWIPNADKKVNDCVVIDPANSNKVLRALNERELRCTDILITHGHFDHIMGVAKLKAQTGAKVYINPLDAGALKDNSVNLSVMAGLSVDPSCVDVPATDDMRFTAAGIDFHVIHTPGHTAGGVCYIVESERVIFSGDTLVRLSYGRTDLKGGDSVALYQSIVYRLFALKGDYRVLPGHERETTLEFERMHNPATRNGACE